MSFDLHVFDLPGLPGDEDSVNLLLEDDSKWGAPLSAVLAVFVAELELRYPSLVDDPDGSPWASWPLTSSSMVDGHALSLNIVWSQAERVSAEIYAACQRHSLTIYDPQAGAVIRPQKVADARKPQRSGWWNRK